MTNEAIAILVLAALALSAQEAGRTPLEAPAERSPRYVLQPGDVLDVKFFYNPELNQQAVIRPDGQITLQLVNEIQAAGITADVLTQKLRERYDKDLAHPELAIVVRSFSSQKAFVDGEVGKPGVIDLVHQMTVMQAIAQAGGMRETARAREVLLIRRGPEGAPKALRIDMGKFLRAEELASDLTLRPFDVVFVPKSRVSKVNTWIDQYLRKNVPITFGFYTPMF